MVERQVAKQITKTDKHSEDREKRQKKWKFKMNRKMRRNIQVLGTILALAIFVFGGCGAMRKMKEKERGERLSVVDERVEVSDSSILNARWLLDGWSAGSSVVTAVMESDSAIAFDPQTGFELQGGRVLYRQASEGSSLLRASSDLAMESRADSVAELDVKEEVHLRSLATDKTREGKSVWFWPLLLFIGAIGITLLVLRKFNWN